MVNGEAPLLGTRDQTLSYPITPAFTEKLPLNGRNILLLMSVATDTGVHTGTKYVNSGIVARVKAPRLAEQEQLEAAPVGVLRSGDRVSGATG